MQNRIIVHMKSWEPPWPRCCRSRALRSSDATILTPIDRFQAPWEVHAVAQAEKGCRFVSHRHDVMRGNVEKLVGQVAKLT